MFHELSTFRLQILLWAHSNGSLGFLSRTTWIYEDFICYPFDYLFPIYFLFIHVYIHFISDPKEVEVEEECQIDEYEIGTIKIAVPRDSSFQGYRSTSI